MSDPAQVIVEDGAVCVKGPNGLLARITTSMAEIIMGEVASERFIPADYDRWLQRVSEIHGITVEEVHRPRWAR